MAREEHARPDNASERNSYVKTKMSTLREGTFLLEYAPTARAEKARQPVFLPLGLSFADLESERFQGIADTRFFPLISRRVASRRRADKDVS